MESSLSSVNLVWNMLQTLMHLLKTLVGGVAGFKWVV